MADLVVRDIDEELVRALEERARSHGRSAEAEHLAILVAALTSPRKRSFAEVLASMPDVGTNGDFERADRPNLKQLPLAEAPRADLAISERGRSPAEPD